MNWSGVPGRRPSCESGSSKARTVELASRAISGAAFTRDASWAMRIGTKTRSARAPAPIKIKKVARMARPRGIKCDSHRTGKESAIATAKPPSRTTGTVGANHISSTRAMTPSTTSTVRVRLEIRMGVERVCA
jgi:hypothetical protein